MPDMFFVELCVPGMIVADLLCTLHFAFAFQDLVTNIHSTVLGVVPLLAKSSCSCKSTLGQGIRTMVLRQNLFYPFRLDVWASFSDMESLVLFRSQFET